MDMALMCGLLIAVALIVMLIWGVPISIAIGLSSMLAILPVMDVNAVVLLVLKEHFLAFQYLH